MAGETTSAPSDTDLLQAVKELIPKLTGDQYKGQQGKIATIGGCREYTGAPFFASFSTLRVGADLSHVFCTNGAATVIKSYSPELIVHPYLPDSHEMPGEADVQRAVETSVADIDRWLERFDVIIVGPGLGRDEAVHQCVKQVLQRARELEKVLVIDADGLYIVTHNLELVRGYERCILTPNKAEFARLASQLEVDLDDTSRGDQLMRIAQALEGPFVVRKGSADGICDGCRTLFCSERGSPRRAGGQGDVLSGCIAAFSAWATTGAEQEQRHERQLELPALMLAAYGACLVARRAAEAAFGKHKRSMVAGDVINELGTVMEAIKPAVD